MKFHGGNNQSVTKKGLVLILLEWKPSTDHRDTLKLQPGRMYWTTVRTLAELRSPKENIFVEESSKHIILGKMINWY